MLFAVEAPQQWASLNCLITLSPHWQMSRVLFLTADRRCNSLKDRSAASLSAEHRDRLQFRNVVPSAQEGGPHVTEDTKLLLLVSVPLF